MLLRDAYSELRGRCMRWMLLQSRGGGVCARNRSAKGAGVGIFEGRWAGLREARYPPGDGGKARQRTPVFGRPCSQRFPDLCRAADGNGIGRVELHEVLLVQIRWQKMREQCPIFDWVPTGPDHACAQQDPPPRCPGRLLSETGEEDRGAWHCRQLSPRSPPTGILWRLPTTMF
jgi:hypothetical protein